MQSVLSDQSISDCRTLYIPDCFSHDSGWTDYLNLSTAYGGSWFAKFATLYHNSDNKITVYASSNLDSRYKYGVKVIVR